jgi:hypothetical protein
MKIACIGWGSLIRCPGELPIKGKWQTDGPLLPVEFARQSDNGRITLVITRGAKPVQTLWILLDSPNIDEAKEALRKREETTLLNIKSMKKGDPLNSDEVEKPISEWLNSKPELDAVIWTGLPPKLPTKGVIEYLHGLENGTLIAAETYIRNTPKQIDTEYRRAIEKEFGWTAIHHW